MGPMLNAYPDSIGGNLAGLVDFIERPEVAGIFSDAYVLPSLYNSDLDRGFSVIDYGLSELATLSDLARLRADKVELKLDFILNHCSAQSPQFLSILHDGAASPYLDFFINWNEFWAGHGEMTPEGYIQPRVDLLEPMFFRKPGLPILLVPFPDGSEVPYWNTFYQEITPDGRVLGQMDVNIQSPKVWDFYTDTLRKLSEYGARIVRLDAFAYASKEPGRANFLNEPETWQILERIAQLANDYGIELLPEIHAEYHTGTHQKIADAGYLTYDFFLPGLVLDAINNGNAADLANWARTIRDSGMRVVNMLGCHDGIPLLDLAGLIPDQRIQTLIDTTVARGGHIKNLHGAKKVSEPQGADAAAADASAVEAVDAGAAADVVVEAPEKPMYYQVNATYYSALAANPRALLLARAIQLFMPGKPQVWYLDLLAGTNDYEAMERAGEGGHKEINRTNLTAADAAARLTEPVVAGQLELLRFRANSPAFAWDSDIDIETPSPSQLQIRWTNGDSTAELEADLATLAFAVTEGNHQVFAQP